jgi:hypothetical protein
MGLDVREGEKLKNGWRKASSFLEHYGFPGMPGLDTAAAGAVGFSECRTTYA